MTAICTVESASKRYLVKGREVQALNRSSLKVEKGEFLAVVGASGSGKSTFLMLMGGLSRPSSGRVLLDDSDLYAMDPRRRAAVRARRIGFVFQTFHLIPYLNALDNVLVPVLSGAGGEARLLRERAKNLLAEFGVAHRAAHRPAELSVGERQRVAMIRALLLSPDILLADEPTGNLDPNTAAQLMTTIVAFNKKGGTVILVTHDPRIAGFAGRIVRIEAGSIVDGSEGRSSPG